MSSIDFAKRELELIGAFDTDKDFYGGLTGKSVMELIELFAKQEHSGMSAAIVSDIFKRLVEWKPLSPLTFEDDEWSDDISGDETYQNKRCPSVFKKGKNGKPYYLDAIVWKYPDGGGFTGTVEDVSSRQFMKDGIVRTPIYIDVIEGEDDWKIKNKKDLKQVKQFYNFKK